MSRVSNADQSLERFRCARADYEHLFRKRIDAFRARFARVSSQSPFDLDESLEAHVRVYLINAMLGALNWRLESRPEDGLPQVLPEAPICSSEHGTRRFLDYVGCEAGTDRPLLIVETKRPNAALPQWNSGLPTLARDSLPELVGLGLERKLNKEWNEWLATLADYARSVHANGGEYPRRVVITNGSWLILFLDPKDAFAPDGTRDIAKILVFHDRDELDRRYSLLYDGLEHQSVLQQAPELTVGNLAFYVQSGSIARYMHGLHLLYNEVPGFTEPSPLIKVKPVLLLRTTWGAWLRVTTGNNHPGEDIPDHLGDFGAHLGRVREQAVALRDNVLHRVGGDTACLRLTEHYADEQSFVTMRTVSELRNRPERCTEFIVATGANTHFLLPEPTVDDCPYHDWAKSQAAGYGALPGAILVRQIEPKSYFRSADRHHCAHLHTVAAKETPITAANRERCGLRSGHEHSAFCEIWRFEQRLCCRTCAFQEVCTRAPGFVLPCPSCSPAAMAEVQTD